jgi:hypothetical protein
VRAFRLDAPGTVRLHVGQRRHYELALELMARRPERAVLMQRSSTVLLGPEEGWDDEAHFHDELLRSLDAGTVLYHIASLDGIRRHLARRASRFPLAGQVRARLPLDDGVVCLPIGSSRRQPIKMLPAEGDSRFGADFKFDRQVRLVLADFAGDVEGLVVSDVGEQQCTLHLAGPPASTMFELCTVLYERCPLLRVAELDACLDGR